MTNQTTFDFSQPSSSEPAREPECAFCFTALYGHRVGPVGHSDDRRVFCDDRCRNRDRELEEMSRKEEERMGRILRRAARRGEL